MVAHDEYGFAGGSRLVTRSNAGPSCILGSFLGPLLW